MTDRLRELAEQAGMDIRAYAEDYPTMGAQLFKFAALVRREALEEAAQECDKLCDRYGSFVTPMPREFGAADSCASAIRAAMEADK